MPVCLSILTCLCSAQALLVKNAQSTLPKKGKSVAIIDRPDMIGGVCVHTGTIPSKTFREAVLHLTGYQHQGFYGKSYMATNKITVSDIMYRVGLVEQAETDIIKNQLRRNNITLVTGLAKFLDPHSVQVTLQKDPSLYSSLSDPDVTPSQHMIVSADKIYIACGTRPARRNDIEFDGKHVFDADQILSSEWTIPRDLIVVGAGVVGIEYASMINIIPGSRVTVIDERPKILPFADKEVIDALCHQMRQQGARFLLGEKIVKVEVKPLNKKRERVLVTLDSGKRIGGDALLYTVGRQGNTDTLDVEKAGLKGTRRGLLEVNKHFQTAVPHIYAGGDCIGFPALASTSMEQGRLASCHMFGEEDVEFKEFFPYGIYTIPEVSMVGKTEDELTAEKIQYEVGIARYQELAKGQMLGGSFGFLKLLFDPQTYKLLGVHCIGEGATEIIHIGQVCLSLGATLEYFRDSVFNYPTMAEAYRVAALNGLQKVDHVYESGDEEDEPEK
eukprot:comp18467_c0_seq1/m.19786 comp18467_c0_seq1/g.19786  ORF comp18467_c0_seq1/g.19786 comp18467_c0_seq1/m.19786 type:complete len:501 (-) comp18467_c0_seq1:140-1642(-)